MSFIQRMRTVRIDGSISDQSNSACERMARLEDSPEGFLARCRERDDAGAASRVRVSRREGAGVLE